MACSKLGEKLFVIFLLCCSLFLCCNQKDQQDIVIIGEKYFSIKKKHISNIFEIGHIENIIKPEKTDESLFASADRIRIDNEGNIFVLDRFSLQVLLRFDKEGTFLNKYGSHGQGPGEYQGIVDFDFDSTGNIYLLTVYKIIKYKKTGAFLEENKLNLLSGGIKIVGDALFVYVNRDRSTGFKNNSAIFVFNKGLKKIDEIGVYDQNLMKYLFLPRILLCGYNKDLYFLDFYDLSYWKYNTKDNTLTKFLFSNKNTRLENIWNKSNLTESDRTEIKLKLHRFNDILYFNNNLFLTETCRESDTHNFWLIDLENHSIDKYSYFKLINSATESQDFITFDYIAGAYSNGLILVFDDNERFNKYRDQKKEFQNIEFNLMDNPLIILLGIKN